MSGTIKSTFDPSTDPLPAATTEFFQTPTLDEYTKPIPEDKGMSATNDPTHFTQTVKPPLQRVGTGQGK